MCKTLTIQRIGLLKKQASYLAQLHEDIDDAQEVGGRQGCTCVATSHVVFIQRTLPLA